MHEEIVFLFLSRWICSEQGVKAGWSLYCCYFALGRTYCCSHLFGWWRERVGTQQDRGGDPRLWGGLITLLKAEATLPAVGNGGWRKGNRDKIQQLRDRVDVWNKQSARKMINRALCCAERDECKGWRGELLFPDKQSNSQWECACWEIWHNQIFNCSFLIIT